MTRIKITAAALLGIMGLAACGGGDDSAAETTTAAAEEAPATEAPSSTPSAEDCVNGSVRNEGPERQRCVTGQWEKVGAVPPAPTEAVCVEGERPRPNSLLVCHDGELVPGGVPTTTPPPLSRDARLAVHECLDAVGLPQHLPAMAIIGGGEYLEEAMSFCDDALTQVEVDGDAQLGADLAFLKLEIAGLNVTWVMGDLEPDASGANPEADAWAAAVTPVIDRITAAAA